MRAKQGDFHPWKKWSSILDSSVFKNLPDPATAQTTRGNYLSRKALSGEVISPCWQHLTTGRSWKKIELWSSTLQRPYQQRHAQDWCVCVCVLLSSVAFVVALVTMVKDRFCCHRRAQIAWYAWHSWVGPFLHEGTSDGHLCHQWKSWSQKHWGTSGFCTSLQCASSLFPLPCMNCARNGMTQTQLRCKLGQPGGVERKSADPGFGTSHGGHILDYTQQSDF
jgi:hypothetical protein